MGLLSEPIAPVVRARVFLGGSFAVYGALPEVFVSELTAVVDPRANGNAGKTKTCHKRLCAIVAGWMPPTLFEANFAQCHQATERRCFVQRYCIVFSRRHSRYVSSPLSEQILERAWRSHLSPTIGTTFDSRMSNKG